MNTKTKKPLPEQCKEEGDTEFHLLIETFIEAMKEEAGEKQTELIRQFNQSCDQFLEHHTDASLDSIAIGIGQYGIPSALAIRELTWVRNFGTQANNENSEEK